MAKKIPNIIPRGKQILVERDEATKMHESENGVYTPTNEEKEKKTTGTVIAVSPEIKDIKKGDRVIFGTFAGDPIQLDQVGKVEYVLLHDDDVLAFLQD